MFVLLTSPIIKHTAVHLHVPNYIAKARSMHTHPYVCGVPLRPHAYTLIGRVGQRLITPETT